MTTSPDTSWFTRSRFGLFVHFGAYSVAARHEWVMNYERMAADEYAVYVRNFDPDLFDARALVRLARRAGAGYAVLTTKHHDGFCLWPTRQGEYSTGATIGRDLVGEFVEACREEGLRVGFYHSLLDWHHPDFTIDRHHPQRGLPDVAAADAGRDMARYREYLHAQVRELLTDYGTIDYLFFDFTEPAEEGGLPGKSAADWDAEALLALCRELQPDMLVNDRLGIPADLVTPEQYQPREGLTRDGRPLVWEACQTINGSWGYHRDNTVAKSSELIIRMLVDSVAKGGNLLLNVGPNGRGEISPGDTDILEDMAAWMRLHRDSVIGAGPAGVEAPPGTLITRHGDRLHVHVLVWPFEHLHLPGLADRVSFARLLHDGSEVHRIALPEGQAANLLTPAGTPADTLTLVLPVRRPDVAIPVIELRLEDAS